MFCYVILPLIFHVHNVVHDNRANIYHLPFYPPSPRYSNERGQLVIAWEIVIMVRKLMIATIATIARDSYVQISWALALVVMALVLQARFSPYERSKHITEDGDVEHGSDILNNIETISLLCLVYTQIISIVYLYIDDGDSSSQSDPMLQSKWVEGLITAALIILNGICVVTLFSFYIWAKIAPIHYKQCDSDGFRCNRGQLTILVRRCNKTAGEKEEEENEEEEELLPGWKMVVPAGQPSESQCHSDVRSLEISYVNEATGETRSERPTASLQHKQSMLETLVEQSDEDSEHEDEESTATGPTDLGTHETRITLRTDRTDDEEGVEMTALESSSSTAADDVHFVSGTRVVKASHPARGSTTVKSNPIHTWNEEMNCV